MTTKQNRTAWVVVGLLGCLAFCLLMAVAGSGAYLLLRSPVPPGHYDHAEFTFDYPEGYKTFADFWPTAFGFPYKPGQDKELDADVLGGVVIPYSSLNAGITEKYLTSVQIYRRALPPSSSLKELYDQRYVSGYSKSNSISDKTLKVDGVMALEKMYTQPRGASWYQFREIWLEKNGKVYIISCRTLPDWFADNQASFNLIVDSFHVK